MLAVLKEIFFSEHRNRLLHLPAHWSKRTQWRIRWCAATPAV